MAHVQLQISRERHRDRGAELDGPAHRRFGTGEIRAAWHRAQLGQLSHSADYQAAAAPRHHSPADGLQLRPQRRKAFVVAGLFVVVFVSLVDFWVF